MAARARDRDSAGRLLRVIADCDLYHMEAAIASLKRVNTGIRSESLLNPSGGDEVDVLERTAEGRVLSLSDHKRIARLQAALTAVVNAYRDGNGAEGSTKSDSNRNLVRTVAGAAIMQATRDCTASRTNCCVWGSQAEKLIFLLDWMVNHERADDDLVQPGHGYVRQLLLEWIGPSAEKQNQLAACLALFELLQRRRQRLTNSASESECLYLLGDQVELYLEALRSIVERGTLAVADSNRVKPSKLALIAFETLLLLCGDVAAYYSSATDSAKITLAGGQLMKSVVESARFAVVVLRQWHLHSIRRQFLGYALQNLQVYAEICQNLLASANEFEGDTATGSTSDAIAGLDVLCWHWCATATLLCTRSDVSSLIKKNQAHQVLARNLRKWAADALRHRLDSGRRGMATNSELVYSQLRYVCLLMDATGGVKGCSKAFEELPVDIKASFVFFFVYGLSVANKSGDGAALQLTLNVLRAVLLPSDPLHLLNSRDEEQELLSQLLREVSSGSIARGISYHDTQAQTELELFIVDFVISRKLFIADLVMWMQDSQSQTIQSATSLTRTLLYQLDHAAFQEPIYRQWRQVLSPVVLALLDHSSYHVRRLVISCLPSLDPVSCIAGLCAAGVLQTENNTVTSALGYLFNTSTQHSLESMMTWFIDSCQYGIFQLQLISEKSPVSPHEWSNYAAEQNGNTKAKAADDEDRKEQQEQLLSLCFGPKGWSNHVRSPNARTQVLSILLRKIFGSPRDSLLLRMLREFVGCGWVDRDVFGILGKQLTSHMMNLQRLTEATLNDNSASAAKTVEGLLFSRLAPLLVLRMLPRDIFGADSTRALLCERDDLDHLNEYIDRQQHVDGSESQTTDSTEEILCHILALSVVDPLEFKEVKMLATEALAKFPPPTVVPFVFAHLLAFLREAGIYRKNSTSLIVNAESIPDGCGLVTAKLMVYYLNRVLAEDDHAYKDQEITMKALVVLAQIMGIPCTQDSSLAVDASLLADLQRGCIDCVGLILSRLDADDKPVGAAKTPTDSAASLVNLLLTWIFDPKLGEKIAEHYGPRAQELLQSLWSEAQHNELPLQVRICCCNVLLSAISRLENSALEPWKSQGFISRVAVATEACFEEDVAAGGLQIIFSFLYKASELFSMENSQDLQLVRNCFDATVSRVESTRSESVAMSGLKVIGALVGKLPSFVGTLPPAEVQRLIDGCLISVRDRRLSPVVSELAQSLLQAMAPP